MQAGIGASTSARRMVHGNSSSTAIAGAGSILAPPSHAASVKSSNAPMTQLQKHQQRQLSAALRLPVTRKPTASVASAAPAVATTAAAAAASSSSALPPPLALQFRGSLALSKPAVSTASAEAELVPLTPDLINSAAKVRVGELDLYLTSLAIDVDDYVSVCQ